MVAVVVVSAVIIFVLSQSFDFFWSLLKLVITVEKSRVCKATELVLLLDEELPLLEHPVDNSATANRVANNAVFENLPFFIFVPP